MAGATETIYVVRSHPDEVDGAAALVFLFLVICSMGLIYSSLRFTHRDDRGLIPVDVGAKDADGDEIALH